MLRRFSASLLTLVVLVLAIPAMASTTKLVVDSPTGDYTGQGQHYTLTPADGDFHMEVGFQENPTGVSLFFHKGYPTYTQWWQIDFCSADDSPLHVGLYPNAWRYGFNLIRADHPAGFQACTDGRCCTKQVGSFEIKQLVRNPDGSIASFWATMSMSCEGNEPPLQLEIMFNVDGSTPTLHQSWGNLKAIYR